MKSFYKLITLLVVLSSVSYKSLSQVLTKEDSLNNGLQISEKATLIGGYGEAAYRNDISAKTASANLTRGVIFIGHKFSNKISFFSELEVEDAKVAGGEAGGEIAFEQLFLKFNLNKNNYITAGLIIPRIGIINENHLPTSFSSVARPRLEQQLIPATWRELGVSIYGSIPIIQGLNYSAALMNGLKSENFEAGTGIREGRFEGRDATAGNLAVTGAFLYYVDKFRIQASGYYGGAAGLSPRAADSLRLNAGAFGTPVMLEEFNVQYRNKGFYGQILMTLVQIPDASQLNIAYAKNVPSEMKGYYGEIGYNLLQTTKFKGKKLNAFVRYENFDLNEEVPKNGIQNGEYCKKYWFAGLAFLPLNNVIIKVDYEHQHTDKPNPALVINPSPNAPAYITDRGFLNIGVGYSF